MIGVNESARFRRQHGAVASRLTGIATSLYFDRPVQLVDADDPKGSHSGRTVVLERAENNAIELVGKGGTIRYADPSGETTTAALVALCVFPSPPELLSPEVL